MRKLYRHPICRRIVTGALLFQMAVNVLANPQGMTVQGGSATATANGSQLTVTASQNAFLNWQSFNIAAGETTTFQQPSASSIVWNRINDQNPSQIFGSLRANGVVVLLNSSGFYFGPNSFVSAAGLVVSTANCLPPQNTGGSWEFNGPPPLASIVNYGRIQIGQGGAAFLIADQVENHGTISAPGGSIGLAAGQTVLLSERPDGRGMSMAVTLPSGSVDNEGRLIADGGTIAMRAQVVNQNGFIQADSVQNQNGVIELVASDQLNLGADSQIVAHGDDSTPGSSGGSVTLKSGNSFSDAAGSQIITTGGARGGNGGDVEISAPNVQSLNSSIDARAQTGWTAGKLFLDPDYIILDASGTGSAGNGTVLAGSNPGSTLDLNVNSAFANLAVSQIILQAAYDITVAAGTAWNLSGTIGANVGGTTSGQLTLEAGRNIIFGDGASISDANNWSVTLNAGYHFANNSVQPGAGSIYLNGGAGLSGGGSIQTASGAINLAAGQDITVGSGYVITTGGGSISAHALAGNIDTGSDAQGYHFNNNVGSLSAAYTLQNGLGGISTAAGGDVTLIAGGDVTSVLPGKGVYYYDGNQVSPNNGTDYTTAGSGAYGSQPGNVTIVAGGNVTGHYLVANGTGSIFAGVQMDANGNPIKDASGNYVLGSTGSAGTDPLNPNFALSLITGGWNVTAAQNILLQEVRNPNGVFDVSGGSSYNHYFNYAPGDYVNLDAGNLVQLGTLPSSLPRLTGTQIPFIYPSIVNIDAGAGGVHLIGGTAPFNQLILFPSPQGSLTLNTTGGGSLVGILPTSSGAPQLFNLIVSDAGHNQYTATANFGVSDHAASPVHLNSPTPIALNISGDMDLVALNVPEAAQINVVGNMNNCGFQGMNLSANDDVTSINVGQTARQNMEISGILNPATDGSLTVGGNINNRSAFTSVTLDLNQLGVQAPDMVELSRAVGNPVSAATLLTSLYYNPTTQLLTYQNISGQTVASVLNLLQHLTVQVYINGVPQWADPNDPVPNIPITTTVSVLTAATAQALLAQYSADNVLSGIPATAGLPTGANGFTIGGGGQFNISAGNVDLGTTPGIQSRGVGLYNVRGVYPLAGLFGNGGVFDRGADIAVNLTGDLTMYSSSIASLNGGNIQVNAGGDINVGSADFTVNTTGARGIYSSSQADVTVLAGGNINLNGSRIAAYNGGNVTVESFNGDINAGTGGSGFVSLNAYYENPSTHAVSPASFTIPGSGILATTFPIDASYPAPPVPVGNILVETPNGNINASAGGIVQLVLNNVNSSSSTVTVLAGEDADGNILSPGRNIDASGSGIIGSTVTLRASGNIIGAIFARNNLDINAVQNVNVTALSEGTATVNAGESLTGTIIGVGGIAASGGSVDATLLSNNAITGDNSGQSGLAQGTAANSASQSMASEDVAKTTEDTTSDNPDDEKKKKGKGIALAQRTGRVTVILPQKNSAKSQTPDPGT
jgi:filamentous hemagglutinin family protein